MGEFDYKYFRDLKDDVLNNMPWGVLGIFVDAWYLCAFGNVGYTFDSYFLERRGKVRGVGHKSSGESCVASTFDQRYPVFFVGHYTREVVVGTLLPGFSNLD